MKKEQKFRSFFFLLLSGMTVFVSPSIQVSCSKHSSQNDNKPETPPNPPTPPDKPTFPKENQHSLSIEEILKANSPLEIISKTPLFQESVANMQKQLNDNDWDFSYNDVGVNEFYKLNKEIGIINEWGKNKYDKMKYTPQNSELEYDMTQKWLPNFDSLDIQDAISKKHNIDWVIKDNQFGFLPSNLSQLLYYCDLESISKIFDINEKINQIKMNFDDEKGSANILIYTQKNKYLFNYLSTDKNTTKALKRNYDFRKYIYDRTLILDFPRMVKTKTIQNLVTKKWNQTLDKYSLSGTAWVFDRIDNDSIPKGYYEFLVGTNLHVLDISSGFNKDRSLATGTHQWTSIVEQPSSFTPKYQKTYNKFWDGGFFTLQGLYTDNYPESDSTTINPENQEYVSHETINTPRKTNIKNSVLVLKSNPNYPTDGNDLDINNNVNKNYAKTQLNTENIVNDLVWYTPEFVTDGTYTIRDSGTQLVFDLKPGYNPNNFLEKSKSDPNDPNQEKWYENWNGKRTGTISNAGADFAITKIVLSKDDIQKLLPTLYEVLDTDKEKEWYLGMGKNNIDPVEIAPNSTLFVGGYPNNEWKSIKTYSGKIRSQERYIPRESQGYFQTYWTKFNEKDNQKFNEYRGMVSWYQNRFISPSMTQQDNDKYMPHGMQIRKVLQQSTITMSNEGRHLENDILLTGASGSMIINSRFELVGTLFLATWQEESFLKVKHSFKNVGVLFKNYTEENKNFNIISQIIDKLKKENIKTYKLNSK